MPDLPEVDPGSLGRRDLLKAAGVVGALGAAGAGGATLLGGSEPAATESVDAAAAERLAAAFAPDLYFGARERWYPTDLRRYESERDGRTVVDGFDALDDYTREFRQSGSPPAPTVFYNVRNYPGSSLSAVQYWFYSVFDQFTTNFHWHDWEVLHVFVDTGGEEPTPVLFVASAHARSVPNNEFLDPPARRASVVSEVGSHSSALGVNGNARFERFPTDGLVADISNRLLDLGNLPLAYGLPRDEGLSLAFAMPELDGAPLFEHPDLPNVSRSDLVPPDVTVDSFTALSSPPTLPAREGATSFTPSGDGDHAYDLRPMSAVEHIDDLVGPQLSFTFAVPGFVEDAVAEHLTTTDLPRTQPRFERPTADITDPTHRATLAERYDPVETPESSELLVGALRSVVGDGDAPEDNGVTTAETGVEGVALLESDPVAVPTFRGVVAVGDPPSGDHRLTVNAPGYAPHAERLAHEGGETIAGADGDLALVENREATKLRADAADGPAVGRLRITDDFGGILYNARPPDDERFAVYVHRGGAYTADVEDEAGEKGAYRVNPAPDREGTPVTIEGVRTGKASLASFVVNVLRETHAQASALADGDFDGFNEAIAGFDPLDGRDFTNETGTDPLASLPTGNVTDGGGDSGTPGTGTGTDTTPGGGGTDGDTGDTGGKGGTDGAGGGTDDAGDTSAPDPLGRLLDALLNATVVAARATGEAARGNASAADNRLRATRNRLAAVRRVAENRRGDLPGPAVKVLDRRLPLAEAKVEDALEA